MADLIIPTRTDLEHYSEEVDLDGVTYTCAFAWNHRDSAWYLSVGDAVGPIASGIRVVVGAPLLRFVPGTRKPLGTLVAIDTSGGNREAGLRDLGARVQLLYQEA